MSRQEILLKLLSSSLGSSLDILEKSQTIELESISICFTHIEEVKQIYENLKNLQNQEKEQAQKIKLSSEKQIVPSRNKQSLTSNQRSKSIKPTEKSRPRDQSPRLPNTKSIADLKKFSTNARILKTEHKDSNVNRSSAHPKERTAVERSRNKTFLDDDKSVKTDKNKSLVSKDESRRDLKKTKTAISLKKDNRGKSREGLNSSSSVHKPLHEIKSFKKLNSEIHDKSKKDNSIVLTGSEKNKISKENEDSNHINVQSVVNVLEFNDLILEPIEQVKVIEEHSENGKPKLKIKPFPVIENIPKFILKLVDDSKFLTNEDTLSLLCVNRESLRIINSNDESKEKIKEKINASILQAMTDLRTFEDKQTSLVNKYNKDELNKEIPIFTTSRGTTKAIELLNESQYFKLFTNPSPPSEDIILPYQIFFYLLGNKIAEIKDEKEFWVECCNFFNSISPKIGDYVNSSYKNFDLTEENVFKIMKLISGQEKKITPTYYSKICGTTGLIIFLIKDTLEYCGALVEKKTVPAKLNRIYMYVIEKFKKEMALIDSIDKKYFS